MRIVLASSNHGKVRELKQLLPDWVEIVTADEAGVTLPEETGTTFLDNALLKARAASQQSRLVSIADDSGLEVDALDGKPGVRSARFAGDDASDDRKQRSPPRDVAGCAEPSDARHAFVRLWRSWHQMGPRFMTKARWKAKSLRRRGAAPGSATIHCFSRAVWSERSRNSHLTKRTK